MCVCGGGGAIHVTFYLFICLFVCSNVDRHPESSHTLSTSHNNQQSVADSNNDENSVANSNNRGGDAPGQLEDDESTVASGNLTVGQRLKRVTKPTYNDNILYNVCVCVCVCVSIIGTLCI